MACNGFDLERTPFRVAFAAALAFALGFLGFEPVNCHRQFLVAHNDRNVCAGRKVCSVGMSSNGDVAYLSASLWEGPSLRCCGG
jgi:hypothetical protein